MCTDEKRIKTIEILRKLCDFILLIVAYHDTKIIISTYKIKLEKDRPNKVDRKHKIHCS